MLARRREAWRFADAASHATACERCERMSPPRVGVPTTPHDWKTKLPGWRAARPVRFYTFKTVDDRPYLRMVRRGASVEALMHEMEHAWVALCRPCALLTQKERKHA